MTFDVTRDTEMLAEFAELALVLARDLHAKALGAETPGEAAEAAQAFHAVGRSLRQSLALKSRLVRDAARAEREGREDDDLQARRRSDRHRFRIEKPLARAIFSETEDEDEAHLLVEQLEDRLAEAVLDDAFLAHPVETHIARLRADLGMAPPPRSSQVSPSGEMSQSDRGARAAGPVGEVLTEGVPHADADADADADYWRSSA